MKKTLLNVLILYNVINANISVLLFPNRDDKK